MGQETSLNCRSSQKQEQHEIETTHANAIHIIKSRNNKPEEQSSDLKSKKSTTIKSEYDERSSFNVSTASHNKSNVSLLPQHENILKVAYSPFPGGERVGNKYTEKGSKNLAEIVETRYNTTMHFPQGQVVALIQSLIYSLRYLQKFQYKHHDYYPTNIHYCNGIFKITNPLLINSSAYVLTQERKRFSFLSPELISEILNETSEAEIPLEVMWKSDIFSIGMIALEFCTLLPSAECYDEENYSLVDKTIKERLVKVSKLYSPNIADCIAEMLRYEVEERITVEELAILIFLSSAQEKMEPQQQDPRMSASKAGPPQGQRPQYQPNPPHVQQQFLILPPGQAPPQGMMHLPPHQQMMPLNQNSIALPTPNYAYTRIGPNNQGLLSPTTLQNKLKVIELIHQHPQEEEESEGQLSYLPSNILPMVSHQPSIEPKFEPQYEPMPTYTVTSPPVVMQRTELPPVQTNPTFYPPQDNFRQRYEQPVRQPPRPQQRQPMRIPQRQPSFIPQKPAFYHETQQLRSQQQQHTRSSSTSYVTSTTSNKFIPKTDQNGQTLQQRVERILQMSRSIK